MRKFIIVGAGPAGHNAALELSRIAPSDSITLIGREPSLPYERPPLSKDFLAGKLNQEDIIFSKSRTYDQVNIKYRKDTVVERLDREAKRVVLSCGEVQEYDDLLLATGSQPRLLPAEIVNGADVYYLRTLEDASALRPHFREGKHIAVIGGGFIGLEVAATARQSGCEVTVIEANDRLLARGMPGHVSQWALDVHLSKGCEMILGASPRAFHRRSGKMVIDLGVREIEADVLVAAIGIVPVLQLGQESGLEIEDGIVVDDRFQTSDSNIYAAGEVVSYPDPWTGRRHRTESWQSSIDQAICAARCMAGQESRYEKVPWLWSDQYEYNIQSLGFPGLATRHRIRFDNTGRNWTLIGLDESSNLVGVVAVNSGRDISMFRRIMASSKQIPTVLLSEFDDAIPPRA